MKRDSFFRAVLLIAVPVALQSMLQASFSIIDQIMIGQLGTVSVAAVGLASKFSSIYNVLVSALATVSGIMIAQYLGNRNQNEVHRSFYLNLVIGVILALVFMVMGIFFSEGVMHLYTKDVNTLAESSGYLFITSFGFIALGLTTMLSTLFRCIEKASLPLYASIVAAVLNTVLNYVFIFIFNFGYRGAAYATVISQYVNLIIVFVMFVKYREVVKKEDKPYDKFNVKWYLGILMPLLVCEFMWSLGENIYAGIYGNMSTASSAAMTLINPIQGLMIGALCGLSSAAGILIGKQLGSREYDLSYKSSKKLLVYGFIGSFILSVVIVLTRGIYVNIYNVENEIKELTKMILVAYAIVAPFKVANMILGGGILRSGG
ncbi:MAG: MATE family efflux transporter, partial [Erysipelotrichaceae bacterium]